MGYLENVLFEERATDGTVRPDSSANIKYDNVLTKAIINSDTKQDVKIGDDLVLSIGLKKSPEVEAKFAEINAKCKILGLNNDSDIAKLLSKHNYNLSLDVNRQLEILDAISSSLDHFISKKQNGKIIVKGFSINNGVSQTAENYSKVKKSGAVSDFNEFMEQVGDINDEIEDEYKSAKNDNEKAKVVQKARNNRRKKLEARKEQELKKCENDQQREVVIQKYNALQDAVEAQRGLEFIVGHELAEARISVYTSGAKNQAAAHDNAIQAFEKEYQEEVANSFTHEFEMQLLQDYYTNGDPISADIYGEIVKTITQYKSEEAIAQYQKDAENQENTPWYTKEHAEAEKRGIESGVTAKTKSGSIKSGESDYNTGYNTYTGRTENMPASENLAEKYTMVAKEPKSTEISSTTYKNNATPKDIAYDIKTGAITMLDAINHFHEKAYDAIFEDPELFARNKAIATLYVNNFRRNLDKLLNLSNFSSAIELIAKNISPTIKENYEQEVKLSGITKNAIFGKGENNEAA